MKQQPSFILTFLYSCLLLVGAILAFFSIAAAPYVFAVGTLMVLLEVLLQMYHSKGKDIRKKRQGRLRLVNVLMLGFAAYYMFIENNSWVVFLLIYALTTLFLSYRTPEN